MIPSTGRPHDLTRAPKRSLGGRPHAGKANEAGGKNHWENTGGCGAPVNNLVGNWDYNNPYNL